MTKLDAKICRQLFRLCVELSMVAHVTAATVPGADEETMKRLRNKCVKDVKNTIGNVRYDSIYAHQHAMTEEDDNFLEKAKKATLIFRPLCSWLIFQSFNYS